MTIYTSKDDIYKDFGIALKFALERPVHVRDYEALFEALARDCRAKVTHFAHSVKNFRTEYPISAGFFVEVPVYGDAGQEIGTRFVLLEHETGWELFIPLAAAAIGWIGAKVGDKALDKVLDGALGRVTNFLQLQWSRLIRGGVRIDHVEIRSENKGVMRIPFSDFDVSQVRCLLSKFDSISHLRECNAECFGGKLVDPGQKHSAPQASD